MSKQLPKQATTERTQRSAARPMATKRAQRSTARPMATKRSTPDDPGRESNAKLAIEVFYTARSTPSDHSAAHDLKVRKLLAKHYKHIDSIPLEKRAIILCAKLAIGWYDVDLVCDEGKPWQVTITERTGGNG